MEIANCKNVLLRYSYSEENSFVSGNDPRNDYGGRKWQCVRDGDNNRYMSCASRDSYYGFMAEKAMGDNMRMSCRTHVECITQLATVTKTGNHQVIIIGYVAYCKCQGGIISFNTV